MAEYVYTISDRETGEILFRGGYRASADFIGCSYHHIVAMATLPYEYNAKTKYSKYKVVRHIQGQPQQGGARFNDIICCDCGVLMKKVGTSRKRCAECQAKHKLVVNREYMRIVRGVTELPTPIKPNPSREGCEGCAYYRGAFDINKCCNYYLDTGIRRPCPPGKECTVKTKRGGYREKEERSTDIP